MSWSVPKRNKVEIIFRPKALEGLSCPTCDGNVMAMLTINSEDQMQCSSCSEMWLVSFDTAEERQQFIERYSR